MLCFAAPYRSVCVEHSLVVETSFFVLCFMFFALLLFLVSPQPFFHSDTETFLCAQNQKKRSEWLVMAQKINNIKVYKTT